MNILATLDIGWWELICIVLTILAIIKLKSVTLVPICGLVIYGLGRLIALPFIFCKWLIISIIKNPIPASIVIGTIVLISAIIYFLNKRKQGKLEMSKHINIAKNTTTIDAEWEPEENH